MFPVSSDWFKEISLDAGVPRNGESCSGSLTQRSDDCMGYTFCGLCVALLRGAQGKNGQC